MADYTPKQLENTIRTYKDALRNNSLTEKEKTLCLKKIKALEKLKNSSLK